MSSGSLAQVARQSGVTAATGGLALTDVTVSGTVPALNADSGSFSSSFTTDTFTVDGVDLADTALGPLSAAKLTAGTALTAADAHANDVLVNSSYATAHKLRTGRTLSIGGTNFKIIGIVERAAGRKSARCLHPAGQGAEHRPGLGQRQAGRQGEHRLRVRRERHGHPGGAAGDRAAAARRHGHRPATWPAR